MTPTTIINNLKSEAVAEAAKNVERLLHYNGYKAIKGRRGFSKSNGLCCTHTIYASGCSRTTYNVGFAKLNYNEAVQFLKNHD